MLDVAQFLYSRAKRRLRGLLSGAAGFEVMNERAGWRRCEILDERCGDAKNGLVRWPFHSRGRGEGVK